MTNKNIIKLFPEAVEVLEGVERDLAGSKNNNICVNLRLMITESIFEFLF